MFQLVFILHFSQGKQLILFPGFQEAVDLPTQLHFQTQEYTSHLQTHPQIQVLIFTCNFRLLFLWLWTRFLAFFGLPKISMCGLCQPGPSSGGDVWRLLGKE
jgi:hypothetical protein